MDVRDPWSKLDFLESFYLNNASRRKYESLETMCLEEADTVLATSPSMHEQLLDFDQSKFKCITNGFDIDDFKGYEKSKTQEGRFVIYHAGLLNELRNPINLWKALGALGDENKEFKAGLKIHLAGTISQDVIDSIKQVQGLSEHLVIESYKAHNKVIEDYGRSDVLLLLINQSDNYKVNIPGKLFEYIASGVPVLSIGKEDADANVILKEGGFGLISEGEDIDHMKSTLRHLWSFQRNNDNIHQYSRQSLTQELAELFNQMIDTNGNN